MKTAKYSRKPFIVDGVQVTTENMSDVAMWCNGVVQMTTANAADNVPAVSYIKVPVQNPAKERQTRAFVGDWVLKSGRQYKVYSNKAFGEAFDPYELVTTASREEAG